MLDRHITQRQIRIFISSTFQDMQEERDYLIRKVFPRIQAAAERRDVSVVPLDLRWGITEEESKSGKVLEICLHEIENSRPFFIGLIGQRYGWCPTKEEFRKNKYLQEQWGEWLENDIEKGMSITEIEMQYGALRSKTPLCAHFYIKQVNNGNYIGDEHLQELKQTIWNNGRYPVNNYHTPEELGKMIEGAFMTYLDELFPDKGLSDDECWNLEQQAILHQFTEVYIPFEENLKVLDKFVSSEEQNYLIIHGDNGTGKSALISQWCKKHEHENVIYHYVRGLNNDESFVQIQKRLCYELCKKTNLVLKASESFKDNEYKNVLASLYRIVSKRGLFVIVIDGIDKLPIPDGGTIFDYLPVLPSKNIKYIFTSTSNDRTVHLFGYKGYLNYQIKQLTIEARIELIEKRLMHFGKKLAHHMVYAIGRNLLCKNLFILNTLLDEIIGYGEHETLNQRINYYLDAPSEHDFYQRILKRYETEFSNCQPFFLLSLINLSLNGFTENELIEIIGLERLHFSQFFCAFHKHLSMRNGRIRIEQKQLRDAIKERYTHYEKTASKAIVDFFSGKKTPRAYEEIAGQYFLMEQDEKLYQLISDIWVAREINSHSLSIYWKTLIKNNKERYSMSVYLRESSFVKHRLRDDYYKFGIIAAHSLSDYNLASDLLQPAWNAYKEIGDKEKLGMVNMECGNMCRITKTYQFAITYLKIALDCYMEVYGQDSTLVADVYNGMGLAYSEMGDSTEAMKSYLKALRIYLDKYGELHSSVSTLFNNIARTIMDYEGPDNAIQYFEKAISIEKSISGDVTEGLATMYNNIGMIYHMQGNYAKALFYYHEALQRANILWSGKNLLCAHCHSNIGTVCLVNKDYDKAENEFLLSIKILSDVVGEGHYETAKNLNNLGVVYHMIGQLKKASQCYHSAVNIMERRMMFRFLTGEDYTQEILDIKKRLQTIDC